MRKMIEENDKSSPTPIPLQKVCLLGLILAANNTSIWMIFSFLPFMVQNYFPNLSRSELGYEAGLLGSAFSAGSLLGNVIWGIISDRYGRRPALLCGLLGTGKF
jgi:MFS family permease